jgi:hypothetical protein
MTKIRWCLAILSILVEIPVYAHDADVVFVRAERSGQNQIVERVRLTLGTLGLLVQKSLSSSDQGAKELEENRQAIETAVWNQMPISAENTPCVRGASTALAHEG